MDVIAVEMSAAAGVSFFLGSTARPALNAVREWWSSLYCEPPKPPMETEADVIKYGYGVLDGITADIKKMYHPDGCECVQCTLSAVTDPPKIKDGALTENAGKIHNAPSGMSLDTYAHKLEAKLKAADECTKAQAKEIVHLQYQVDVIKGRPINTSAEEHHRLITALKNADTQLKQLGESYTEARQQLKAYDVVFEELSENKLPGFRIESAGCSLGGEKLYKIKTEKRSPAGAQF